MIDINKRQGELIIAHTTVKGQRSKYSKLDHKDAMKVRELQEAMVCPSVVNLAHAIYHNVIGNYLFTRSGV